MLPDSTYFSSKIMVDKQSTMYDSNGQDIPKIIYVKEKQLLKIPEITGYYNLPNNIKWTGKMIQLIFNGNNFSRPNN